MIPRRQLCSDCTRIPSDSLTRKGHEKVGGKSFGTSNDKRRTADIHDDVVVCCFG